MAVTLAELAQHIGAEVRGDGTRQIDGVATLATAGPREIAYVTSDRYAAQLATTAAGAVILSPAHVALCRGDALVASDPRLAFARAAQFLYPVMHHTGVHPTAVVHPSARVASSAWVGPLAILEAHAEVAERCQIGPGCYVGEGARIGADTRLSAHAVLAARCVLGERVLVHPGAVIGADGFGFARDGERWVKVPQLGRVVVGDDVEIGANTTVDRGALDDTVIGNGVKLDNLIQIAHNVRIGDHTAIAAQVGIAGSTVIGKRCTIAGQAGIIGHLEIADDVHITATSMVTNSIREPGVYSSGLKAVPAEEWRRNAVRLGQLDEIARRLKKLEDRLKQTPGEGSI
jgi:UDP-3-O-[3-hydroxymyristoyl] glucosamine N-acyltransferase